MFVCCHYWLSHSDPLHMSFQEQLPDSACKFQSWSNSHSHSRGSTQTKNFQWQVLAWHSWGSYAPRKHKYWRVFFSYYSKTLSCPVEWNNLGYKDPHCKLWCSALLMGTADPTLNYIPCKCQCFPMLRAVYLICLLWMHRKDKRNQTILIFGLPPEISQA